MNSGARLNIGGGGLADMGIQLGVGLLANKVGGWLGIGKKKAKKPPKVQSIVPAVRGLNRAEAAEMDMSAFEWLDRAIRSGASGGQLQAVIRQNQSGKRKYDAIAADRAIEARRSEAYANAGIANIGYQNDLNQTNQQNQNQLSNWVAGTELVATTILDRNRRT